MVTNEYVFFWDRTIYHWICVTDYGQVVIIVVLIIVVQCKKVQNDFCEILCKL